MPNSEYLKDSKIQMTSKNFVKVDKVSGSPDYLQHISLTCTFSPNLCFGTLIISSLCVSLLQYMHTNVPDVFCGGDLAMFPLAIAKNRMVNIGHWQMAQAQGEAGNI